MSLQTEVVHPPHTGEPCLKNEDLAKAAREAIEWLTTVPLEGLQVTARDGRVKLHGRLQWRHQRNTVEDVVRHLPGVKGVANLIEVQPPPGTMESRAPL
jgi:osmotically-inducible protein OsmY